MFRLSIVLLWATAACIHAATVDSSSQAKFSIPSKRNPRPLRKTPKPLHMGTGVQFKLHRSARVGDVKKSSLRGAHANLVDVDEGASGNFAVVAEQQRVRELVELVTRALSHLTNGVAPTRVFRLAGVHEAKHEAFGLHLWYRVDAASTSSDYSAGSHRRRTQNTDANTMTSSFKNNTLPLVTRTSLSNKNVSQEEASQEDDAGSEPFRWFTQQHAYAARVANLAHQLRHHPALAGFIELVEEEVRADHHGSSTSKGSSKGSGNSGASGGGKSNSSDKTPSPTPDSSHVPSYSASALNKSTSITATKTFFSSEDASSSHNLVAYAPNDPRFNDQSHYGAIHVPQAWTLTAGVPSVVVQVIDSGVDGTHPDLQGNRWLNPGSTTATDSGSSDSKEGFGDDQECSDGVDNDNNGFIDDCWGFNHADDHGGLDLMGSNSHGTHCAGTISAQNDNNIGVAGIAGGKGGNAGASLMVSVVFGTTQTSGFAEALVYGADNGAHVSSNSWGYTTAGVYESAVLDAIDYAVAQGTIVVFASGNDGTNQEWFPAAYNATVAVAAVANHGEVPYFSNYGTWVDLVAPGYPVLSTVSVAEGSYEWYTGTSMACPHVSGVLALGKSYRENATSTELVDCLTSTAIDMDGVNVAAYEGKLGAGLIHAVNFLDCVGGMPTPSPTLTPAPTQSFSPTPAPSLGCPSYSSTKDSAQCNSTLTLVVTTDAWPAESSFAFESSDPCFSEAAVSGPAERWAAKTTTTVTIATGLCLGVPYTFTYKDSFGDGMCCTFGQGSYQLLLDQSVIFTSDGAFGDSESTTFTPGDLENNNTTITMVPTPMPAPAPTPAPVSAPTPAPTAAVEKVVKSEKTCGQLGWANSGKFGDSEVCGGSYLNLGGCQATDVKWWQARVFCERSGARLCTSKELLEDETRSTGCGLDRQRVWSSTPCGVAKNGATKYYQGFGSSVYGTSLKCKTKQAATAPARCCADQGVHASKPDFGGGGSGGGGNYGDGDNDDDDDDDGSGDEEDEGDTDDNSDEEEDKDDDDDDVDQDDDSEQAENDDGGSGKNAGGNGGGSKNNNNAPPEVRNPGSGPGKQGV